MSVLRCGHLAIALVGRIHSSYGTAGTIHICEVIFFAAVGTLHNLTQRHFLRLYLYGLLLCHLYKSESIARSNVVPVC